MYLKEVAHQKQENAKLRDRMKQLLARRPAEQSQSVLDPAQFQNEVAQLRDLVAEKEGIIGSLSTQLSEMSETARQADWQ